MASNSQSASHKPVPLLVLPEKIPQELRDIPHWVTWRYQWRKDDWTKPPYDAHSGKPAKSTEPATWSDYKGALVAYQAGEFDGIGIVLTEALGIVGIDLDKCRDAESGHIESWAEAIIREVDSYTEVSPSGTGIRIIVHGRKTSGRCRKGAVEVYVTGRYLTISGHHIPGTPTTIEERTEAIGRMCARVFGDQVGPKPCSNGTHKGDGASSGGLTDGQILDKARRARNSANFSRLWDGDTSGHDGDASRADLSLCVLLAFWSQDAQQIDRLFRQSELYRSKWDERRGESTYGQRTIHEALQRQRQHYRGNGRARASFNMGEGTADTSKKPDASDDTKARVHLTDRGNALRLVTRFGTDLRYCHPWHTWLCWEGKRWKEDETGAAMRRAKETISLATADTLEEIKRLGQAINDADGEERGLQEKRDKAQKALKWFFRSEAAERLKAMLTLAQSDRPIPILPSVMDRDPFLLNCPNGSLDLRTGKLLEHRREDYVTRLCPVHFDSNATCPIWEKSLAQVFDGDSELTEFFWRLVGLFLTGDVTEHLLIVFHGNGANGKTLLLNTLLALLGGDYSVKCPPDLFLWRKSEAHPTERAILHGKRLAVCSETPQGRYLNESLVKELTGGEPITARRMREDFWTFDPTHKLVVATNYKPAITGDDDGIWRRVRLVPFAVQFWDPDDPKNHIRGLDPALRQDKGLSAKLKTELPGVLAWAVRGALEWQRDGLTLPAQVQAATSDYRQGEDRIGRFIMERCTTGPDYRVKASELYAKFKGWCEATGEQCVTQTTFGETLARRGFERYTSNGTWYRGIALAKMGRDCDS